MKGLGEKEKAWERKKKPGRERKSPGEKEKARERMKGLEKPFIGP